MGPIKTIMSAVTATALGAAAPAFAGPTVAIVTDSQGYVHQVVQPVDGDSTVVSTLRNVVEQRQGGELRHVSDASKLDLDGVDVVIFYTTGNIPLDVEAFQTWVENGGGMLGLHCATDTLMDNPQFVDLIGAAFKEHPWTQSDPVVLDRVSDDPIVTMINDGQRLQEEIYTFRENPTGVDVHLRLDLEETPKKVENLDEVPVVWTKDVGKGRVAYTSLGHNQAVWESEMYRKHLEALITHADGDSSADGETMRGRTPWVFRCTLDGRARVVVTALGDDLWAAYDATSCGLYKVWDGSIDLTGSVYDTRHGPQPQAEGEVLDQFGDESWFLIDGEESTAVTPQWAGYDMDGTKAVYFHYRIPTDNGTVEITESVDVAGKGVMKRTFDVKGDAGDAKLRVMLANGDATVEADGGEHITEERGQGAVHFLELPASGKATVTVSWAKEQEEMN